VSLVEAHKIIYRMQEELASGIQGTINRDKYMFQEQRVANSLLWPIEKKMAWLEIVVEAIHAYYIVKITQG
jgi:hypothetical protein